MTAVDTNVVVRLLTRDEPRQASAAQAVFAAGPVWIAKTVLLEASWVLRSLYGFDDGAVCAAFAKLLGLPNVEAEDEPAVAAALAAQGIEFADALHLTSRPPEAAFVSFDKAFLRRARRAGVDSVGQVEEKF